MVEPYYTDTKPDIAIYNGDCRTVMGQLEPQSVDSVVCDPPYELGFMGKGWDRSGIAYDVSVWRECLRVLKPGAHLLAFGGSRTYHRLACAIEDAGFEIRDQIQWIYSSGFPKSLNVSKNLREEEFVCTCNEDGKALPQHGLRSLSDADLPSPLYADDQSREVLQSRLSEQGPPEYRTTRAKSKTSGLQQSSMEGRRDGVQDEGQLHRSAICESATMGVADGSQGWLHHGASSDHGSNVRISIDENGSGQPLESQTLHQRRDESGAVADERGSQARGVWPLCPRCCKPILPEGIGSALKPAHEPIVLARKPITGTLIQNVLQHGTGGLNIDGCRVEMSARDAADIESMGGFGRQGYTRPRTEETFMQGTPSATAATAHALGRWPANVIHDGSEEVLAAFPDAPGQQGDLSAHSKDRLSKGIFGDMKSARDAVARLDSGSAARFFYCAKATQEDRNEGLEDLPHRVSDNGHKRPRTELDDPRRHGVTPRQNFHPTVKPTELMRYLCRLITPPGGLVLDVFAGSGSTGKAAMLEGLRFIGIELDPDYCKLAQLRIEAALKQLRLF